MLKSKTKNKKLMEEIVNVQSRNSKLISFNVCDNKQIGNKLINPIVTDNNLINLKNFLEFLQLRLYNK